MAKQVVTKIKLQVPAAQANPSPPVGPALGQHGVNIMEFCKAFNAQTQAQPGVITPVVVSVYADRSFSFMYQISSRRRIAQAGGWSRQGGGSAEPGKGWASDDRAVAADC